MEVIPVVRMDNYVRLTREKLTPLLRYGTIDGRTIGVILLTTLIAKLVYWKWRVYRFRKSMPVFPVLLPPSSLFRALWPRKWQTFHYSWYLHSNRTGRRTIYEQAGSDVFALVTLFGPDYVCVSDPEVFVEIKVNGATQYPKDLRTVKAV
jgi:hypothetical protein